MNDSPQDIEFMEQLAAAARMKPHAASNILLWSIAAMIVFFILWASFSEIEELTRGQGQVVPTQEIQVVQSLEGGILQELLVAQGDRVAKGQVLMRLSDVMFASEERGAEAKADSLKLKTARLEAEAEGKDFIVAEDLKARAPEIARNELALYQSRQQELKNALSILDDKIQKVKADQDETQAQINRLSSSRGLLNQELAITREMVAKKAVSKLEQMRLEREVADIGGQINALQEKSGGLKSELSAAERQRADQQDRFRSQALTELSEVKTQSALLTENLRSIGDRVSRAELKAPVEGIVNNIAVRTIGGVIEPAQKLVEIVPVDSALKIIAKVLPSDVAFLRVGQDVKVKISAYDPQRYGALDGKLVRIGASTVSDSEGNVFFEIEVRTARNYLGAAEHPLAVTPGMVADTEVVTGKRTIMQYLLKPFLQARDRALREP
ncbi:MAG: HlyD family type I secretion periplasmic adaptor subunit [Micavibrio aeruginosavorus]|uniref:HlyD family type I secretion periplasmic adaptor subunit n=1 Tax=Micavibrio aeruginosavorus TaxID=349221 RepID=A0A7T5R1Y4_9BACT|nr:MAG: HlyD family type I secretion periplasmic adaptor subunit [Micavibrio aeruginosavorus]